MGADLEGDLFEESWALFHARLVALLSAGVEMGSFALFAPSEAAEPQCFQVLWTDNCRTLRIDASAGGTSEVGFDPDEATTMLSRCEACADAVIATVRDEYGLLHPALLTVAADDDLSGLIDILQLARTEDVGVDANATPGNQAQVLWPDDTVTLDDMVLTHLRDRFGAVETDEDGDHPIQPGGFGMWVRVAQGQPAINMMAVVLRGVVDRKRTDTELNILNRTCSWVRWSRRGTTVWQELTMLARPFVPEQFDGLLNLFANTGLETLPDLCDRIDVRD